MNKAVLFLIIFLAGSFSGFFIGNFQGVKKGITEGREAAAQRSSAEIAQLNKALDFFVPPFPAEIFSTSGEIKAIEGNTISLEIASLQERNLPGVEPKKEMRRVSVSENTVLVRFNPYEPPKISAKGVPEPPELEPIAFADLKVGQTITATAKESIKTKGAFEAAEIRLLVERR